MIPRNFLDSAYKPLTNEQFQMFLALYASFMDANARINLSAIADEQAIWEKHFYDSLLGAEFVEKGGDKVLDIGSGGGFPALPLAIVFPGKELYPFDSVGKKMKAVEEIAVTSGIRNIYCRTGRAEDFGRNPEYREQFDIVTVRACAVFSVCLELALPFLKLQGTLVVYRGPEQEENADELTDCFGALIHHRKKESLPSGDYREIWKIVKIRSTEKIFPRANGVPKRQPMTLKNFKQ